MPISEKLLVGKCFQRFTVALLQDVLQWYEYNSLYATSYCVSATRYSEYGLCPTVPAGSSNLEQREHNQLAGRNENTYFRAPRTVLYRYEYQVSLTLHSRYRYR
jgi:hypothetical protein